MGALSQTAEGPSNCVPLLYRSSVTRFKTGGKRVASLPAIRLCCNLRGGILDGARRFPVTHSSNSTISSSLLSQVRSLDPVAWQRLVHVYGPVIFRWCLAEGLRAEDAADVGQEVFRAVAERVPLFRRELPSDTFLGWLRGITKHKIVDFQRRGAQFPLVMGGSDFSRSLAELPAVDTSEGSESAPVRSPEQGLLYRRALQLLQQEFQPKTWKAFWATAVEGRPTRDVALDLELTEMAVRQAKSRVLRRLRSVFSESSDGA